MSCSSRSLAVGSKICYRLFSLSSVDRLDLIYESSSDLDEDVCLVERLFSSSLVAVVSLSSPRKLKVCHFKKGTEICNYSYSNTILAVKLNRAVIVPFFPKILISILTWNILFVVEASCVSGGIVVHPQYPGYESPAHDSGYSAKPAGPLCTISK